MTNRKARSLVRLILPAVAAAAPLNLAGCGGDDTVRGAGSIEVPRPTTYYSPEEEEAHRDHAEAAPG